MFRRHLLRIRATKTGALICGVFLALSTPLAAHEEPKSDLALMGTIPIYWGEADGLSELLDSSAQPHWARAVIERDYHITPLDFLTEEALTPHRYLLLAQPRGLGATENVALDAWVRAGGALMLFADPIMTGDSRFSIGDRRRPQDVTLLSPILTHWGLEMHFDDTLPAALEMRDLGGKQVPVNLPGRFQLLGEGQDCTLFADGLTAICNLGLGHVVVMADAAMLDFNGPLPNAEMILESLLGEFFTGNGDFAGQEAAQDSGQTPD